jgi:hypothetical protein
MNRYHALVAAARVASRRRRTVIARPREAGDVSGWVLITLMTAMLVAALVAVARPQLIALFQRALATVSG